MTPAIGDVFTAPWGRYAVHRVAGDQVVLRDLDRPSACVTPTLAELAERYTATGEARPPAARQLAQEPSPAPLAPAEPERPPAAATSRLADHRRRCGGCGLPAIAMAVTDSGAEYCFRCYGVSAQQQREATGALSTGWRPPAGEDYESRSEVGSFAPPPPEQQRPRERAPAKPARVKPDDWQLFTQGRPT